MRVSAGYGPRNTNNAAMRVQGQNILWKGKLTLSLDPCTIAIMQGKTSFLPHTYTHTKQISCALHQYCYRWRLTMVHAPCLTCCFLVLPSVYTMPCQLACREQHHSLTKISPHTNTIHFFIYDHRVVTYYKLQRTYYLFEPERTSPKLGINFFLLFFRVKGYWLRENKNKFKKIPLVAKPCKEDSRRNRDMRGSPI